jgi:hypothetical protein
MSVRPRVLLVRREGTTGWHVRVVGEAPIDLSDLGVELHGATLSFVDRALSLKSADARVRLEGADDGLGRAKPFRLVAPRGVLEGVVFSADERSRKPPLTPRVLAAIDAVRRDDTESNRLVLCDVLEEAGAVAEAEYVRRDVALQQQGDSDVGGFIKGVQELRALEAVVGPTFRYLVGRDIAGCAGVRWAFRCPRSWAELVETGRASERVCTTCRQVVVEVFNEANAQQLADQGVCVSVRAGGAVGVRGSVAAPRFERIAPTAPRTPPVSTTSAPSPWWKRLFGR